MAITHTYVLACMPLIVVTIVESASSLLCRTRRFGRTHGWVRPHVNLLIYTSSIYLEKMIVIEVLATSAVLHSDMRDHVGTAI